MHRLRALAATVSLGILSIGAPTPIRAEPMPDIIYPETRRDDIVEDHFGEKVADPYRWLEADVRGAPDVADWVARENAVTESYLADLPQRARFEERIRAFMDFERFGLPVKAGKRYFYTRNTGLQPQAQLFVRHGLDGEPRLLLDPNAWAKDGATALDAWEPSDKGHYLLYSVQDGGSDWRILRVLDVKTGEPLADEIRWAKFTGLAWVGKEGFLYSRFPESEEGAAFQSLNYNQAVYFHRLGTAQTEDELVYTTPDHPDYGHTAQVTQDGRIAVITSHVGTDARYEVRAIDLAHRKRDGWKTQVLVTGFTDDWKLVEGSGQNLWYVTNKDAPRYRLVSIDLSARAPDWTELVAERDDILERAGIVGDRLVLNYMRDAASHAEIIGLDGSPGRTLTLSGIGTASGFRGRPGDPETFYAFSSFNCPAAIYRLDLSTGQSKPFAQPSLCYDPDAYLVEQRFYQSKDGTRVPMFIVRSKAVAKAGKAVPTLLYGYGGFDVSLTPSFSATRMAWLEAGGAFALANLRGGGEYGREWHDAGRRENKQNVFDDFIAASEYLIDEGIAKKDGLAIQGGSNGGLLVGAVVNQRPDLFAAAVAQVGVMDMLRFDRFTAGRYWVDDYGHPDREEDFRILRAYSPYHNIRDGADYPAILVTTADTDDRVVPGHSFKYAAALQAADLGDKPHLIRIETRAGHGSGKPTDKAIEEGADILAFVAQWTGLALPDDVKDVHKNKD
ncbi:prolyl oligopeptidase family serine peptidase [Novosphingobium mangrovi (ex Huang et al. 2023)]|uniref:prolyl oligopeptidase n=1 Tax=Novosphingobium mangrovi (ex Huang et al. 2023) TaxID=2976432 RepID=A0ABT2I6B0_9SPHN|nr:prolyl oligopeptidase family serine peptidase [Novosphingobium mangrovi (ex Huang et al. 2023)]MCT2400138.1 prolyl oligopeptidase family serine peptidase [Novosphingobium mangrovi (ex Huang et al. 2023)]